MYYTFQIALIIYSFSMIIIVWQFTKRNYYRPAYAILWLFTAIVFVALSIFPKPIILLAEFFQLTDASSVFWAMGLSFTSVLLSLHTVLLSGSSRKTKELAQEVSILEWRIEQLEKNQRQLMENKEEAAQFDEIIYETSNTNTTPSLSLHPTSKGKK